MDAEIHRLLVRYCELVDAADWDGVGELFADGVLTDDRGREIARGAGGVAEFYRRSVILHGGSPRTKHLVLNPIARETSDDDSAVVDSSYLVLQSVDGSSLEPIITGRYTDTFERSGSTWRWTERRFFMDLAGDLSRHLTFSV